MQKFTPSSLPGFWHSALSEFKKLRSITGAGILGAVELLLNQFTLVVSPVMEIGFAFLATALSAYLYGPFVAGVAGVAMDTLGYLLRPSGPFSFGYTLNAFLGGFIYGCWLYRRQVRLWRVLAACASTLFLFSFVLNPIWNHLLYGSAYVLISQVRIVKNIIILPINTALLYGALKVLEKNKNRLTARP